MALAPLLQNVHALSSRTWKDTPPFCFCLSFVHLVSSGARPHFRGRQRGRESGEANLNASGSLLKLSGVSCGGYHFRREFASAATVKAPRQRRRENDEAGCDAGKQEDR
ncbi:hypothetical protein CBR_g12737 [Chara braunii]|uniref:Uncharacterized protein n=1 Tax=Chara braunii TaxID=69332 RepID=A0A388KSP2_CHABU|nr:hypothetical protein CBR_g12737 [Chara braunii]|eukprot:GBG73018.1 hypothetical protein CBR_g12737 [Chara braunii]